MSRFTIQATPIAGVYEITRQIIGDHRGFFSRFFCAEELAAGGFNEPVAQINHSFTQRRGTVRGLHFQHPPHGEIKLVSCLAGKVFDVAVDLRRNSPTFLRWHAVELSAERRNSLLIPKGCAHGFQTLEDDCEMLYLSSTPYAPQAEGGIRPDDERLAIAWPLAISDCSERDRNHPLLSTDFAGIDLQLQAKAP
jgi:dTDP-4-dehydrorhamnose 3,5-epimerase